LRSKQNLFYDSGVMLRQRVFLWALFAVTLRGGAARADIVVSDPPNDVDRYVDTAATSGVPMTISNMTTGLFTAAAASSGIVGNLVSTTASQTSTIGTITNSISGDGDVHAAVHAVNGTWSPLADSLFDVTFEVDVETTYSFRASAAWLGDDSPFLDGIAQVSFQDVTNGPDVAPMIGSSGATPLADHVGPLLVTLSPGVDYRLTARAIIAGGGFPGIFEANASWSFTLTPVPEARSLALLSPIVLGAALGVWWSKRRGRR
jgi:hypothetical protein